MLPKWYGEYKQLIEKSLIEYLEKYFESEKNPSLNIIKEASIYAIKGGKRIRSILALEFYLIFSGKDISEIKRDDEILKFCIAIELLHGYSLVHDDLPALDNDNYRRGELTTWKKYGEVIGILAGDLLNSLAFEVLSETGNIELIKLFGNAVGINGMLGGQVLDIHYEYNPDELNIQNLLEIHNKKTGALIQTSILGGIILANEEISYKDLNIYAEFGKKLGLAFQIKDDLLDVEGTFEETGKSVGGEKKGFVHFMGLDETKKYLELTSQDCYDIIKKLNAEKIEFLIGYIKSRKK